MPSSSLSARFLIAPDYFLTLIIARFDEKCTIYRKFFGLAILKAETKYGRIMQRRGKKRAIIAIARMMLTSIFAMFTTGEVFNPCDILQFDMPEELKKKQTLSAAKDAVKLLVSLGLVAEDSISLQPLAS